MVERAAAAAAEVDDRCLLLLLLEDGDAPIKRALRRSCCEASAAGGGGGGNPSSNDRYRFNRGFVAALRAARDARWLFAARAAVDDDGAAVVGRAPAADNKNSKDDDGSLTAAAACMRLDTDGAAVLAPVASVSALVVPEAADCERLGVVIVVAPISGCCCEFNEAFAAFCIKEPLIPVI